MTLSYTDKEILKDAGFIDYEIKQFDEAVTGAGMPQTINLGSETWKAMVKSRSEWRDDKIERGWSEEEMENAIMTYYQRDQKRTPFDFLRREYRPPKKVDYMASLKRRQDAKTIEQASSYDVANFYARRSWKYE